ncbi:hypothetical protein ACHAXS_000409, partial [Conticribra weissflogii]
MIQQHLKMVLSENGFYFIGNSAYTLKSLLITTFDNAIHGTSEDNFNLFFLLWIKVECTFGDTDLRWGILQISFSFTFAQNIK